MLQQILCQLFFVSLATIITVSPTYAIFIGNIQGGTDFPQGGASFADAVVSYSPGLVGGVPTEPHRGPLNALGVPDFVGVEQCQSQSDCTFVSLGKGGVLVLQFMDNRLTGSGNNSFDLWIFEVGENIENTFVDISKDEANWFSVGKAFGSTYGIDIDAFGFGPSDMFSFVRLTDDPNQGDHESWTAGADIDAVGAISSAIRIEQAIPEAAVPEPASLALMCFGLVALFIAHGRSRTVKR
jgi:hypothetical protein